MCGILAYSGTKAFTAKQACLDALAHRGPDTAAFSEENPDGTVVFGHRRLSIIDVDAQSDQPMTSASGKTSITFNGEIYNYKQLREELKNEGVVFRTQGDTEVILEGYERHGVQFFETMRGMWAFVLHDKRNDTLMLARDPFGIKPLVYALQDGELYCASEIKCLKKALVLEPNPESYAAFYALGYFIAPQTPYKNVFRLRAGEVLSWSISNRLITPIARTSRYMDSTEKVTKKNALDVLDAALMDSVEAHYVADVPVSMLLSGGTDSSLIAAYSKRLGRTPTAYHVAIEGSDDTRYAEAIAKHLGISLSTEHLTHAVLKAQYEKVWDLLDEPTGDVSIIPTSLVFERIKGKAKVVLSGEGGDELFGGYLRHRTLANHAVVRDTHPANALFNALRSPRADSPVWNPILERVRTQFFTRGIVNDLVGAYLMSARIISTPFEDDRIRKQLAALYASDYDLRMLPMLAFDMISYLPNDLLPKSDIASMMSSIEARVPLVDRRVATVAHAVLDATGKPIGDKRILKEILARYIPQELAFRGKSGFGITIHSYDPQAFTADFDAACSFHVEHADAFGVNAEMRRIISERGSTRNTIARKFPRFAFALISNWKLAS